MKYFNHELIIMKADFLQFEKVLKRQKSDKVNLCEFWVYTPYLEKILGETAPTEPLEYALWKARAFEAAGYDFVTILPPDFWFWANPKLSQSSKSLNDSPTITKREEFEKYIWPNVNNIDFTFFDKVAKGLPNGMKMIAYGPNGVLENVIDLMGYDNLCYNIYDEPQLVKDIFDKVGNILLDYYTEAVKNPGVGAILSNDDWGFKNQTLISVNQMREYLFPWHKKISAAAHAVNKYSMVHSCGYFKEIADDFINDLKFDAKHSYEDVIMTVEEAYNNYGKSFAVLGGMDVDFLARKTPAEIKARAMKMIELTNNTGYALGSGNSIANYIPFENYKAMLDCKIELL